MRSPAAAIAWQFGRRHRWGFAAMAAYVVALAVIRTVIAVTGLRIAFDNTETFAFVVVVPMTATFLYFLAIFSFGLDGDFSGRQSIYPARYFTMPVSSNALVGWPMVYGSIAIALLWLATSLLGIWPADVYVPVIWPLLLGPSLLAWTQALAWMPYPAAGFRPIVMVLWLATIDAIVMIALYYRPPTLLMLAILAPHVPLAFLVARYAVRQARCGGGQASGAPAPSPAKSAAVGGGAPRCFRSAHAAQFWFEWRQHGRALPALVAMLLPFEMAMLFVFADVPDIVVEIVVLTLTTPPLMAMFTAPAMSRLTPFHSVRPLADRSLVGAKLRTAVASTFAAWSLVLITLPIGLRVSGAMPVIVEHAQTTVEIFGSARAAVIAILLFAFLVTATWKQLVQSLYIGMSRREWASKASVFGTLTLVAVAGPLLHWIFSNHAVLVALWYAFPWIAFALVAVKISAASWIVVRLDKRLSILVAVGWNVAVFAVYAALAWIFPEMIVRSYVLAPVAILSVPVTRVSAAVVALERSRHR